MGGSQNATTRNESTTFNVSNIGLDQQTVNNISQICDIENKSSNLVQIVGSTVNNLDIKQKNAVKALCQMQQAIKQTQDSTAQNEILSKLSQAAKASSEGGFMSGPGTSSATNISKTYNQMNTKLTQTQINNITAKCILDQNTSNVVQIFGSDVQNTKVDQLNENYLECVNGINAEMLNKAQTENKATTETSQTSTGTTKSGGIADSLASLASGMVSLLPFVIPIFISIILIVCCSVISGSAAMSGGGGAPGGAAGGAPGGGGEGMKDTLGFASSMIKSFKK
jgi:hypothetical protein